MSGIWIKDLKFKTNLHQNVLNKSLKTLESKKLIKSVKSIKVVLSLIVRMQPKRSICFMTLSLQPT